MTDHDFTEYVEHRTGLQMDRLLHYGHWIPSNRGWTREYVEEHFPGWTWNRLIDVCRTAGVVDPTSGGGSPLRCVAEVKAFHFTDATTFAVEWLDGTVTVGPSPISKEDGR